MHLRYYENLAYNVMTELYQTNKSDARKLLVKKNKKYGSTTIFEITDSNNLMQFMGHTACQTQLTSIWKGKIPTYTTDVTVCICKTPSCKVNFKRTELYAISF